MSAQTAMLSALAISISAVSPAAADPAELPEGTPIDGVRLSGLDDPIQQERHLALLRSPRSERISTDAIAADIRRLWETRQFSQVSCALIDRQLVFDVEERRRPARTPSEAAPVVASITFTGNREIGAAELAAHLVSRGKPLDRDELWRDELRLRATYRDRGFLDATIGKPATGIAGGRLHVRFAIIEGPRYRFGSIDPRASRRLASGTPYSHRAVAAAAADIAAELGDRGHAFAAVEPTLRINPAAHRVDVGFTVSPGEVTRVAQVVIRGNDKTRDRVIRRELEIAEGDPFVASAVERSRRRIAALGYFESVEAETSPGASPREAVVTFTVEERPTGSFQIGAGFSSVESFVASARIEQTNLFGTGQSLSLAAQLSALRQLFAVRWTNPSLLDSDWGIGAELYNSRRLWDGFVREAVGGAVTLGHPLGRRWSASVTYRLEEVSARSGSIWAAARAIEPGAIGPEVFHGGVVSSLRGTLAYDGRDDRLRPRRGSHAGAFVEVASPMIGSEVDLVRAGGWARHHRPVVGPVGLHAGVEVGVISTRDPAGVPLAHRYHLTEVRGYAPGSLGPRVRLGVEPDGELAELGLGGNLMTTATVELTAPVIDAIGLGLVVFADAGQVFNLDRRYCDAAGCPRSPFELLRSLRASVGFGLRWDSPLGPLRFEWGFPLFRRPGEDWARFHFGIGQHLL